MDSSSEFTWVDGERLIRYGAAVAEQAPELLAGRGFEGFALLTTERAATQAPAVAGAADVVLHVPDRPVPEAAAAVRGDVRGRPVVALGGGRVIDSAKGIGGADSLPVAAIPTTLSGAEFTRFHRMPAGVDQFTLVRPSVVINDPDVMASQPMPGLAASALNAMTHAVESLYTPLTNPAAELTGLKAIELIAQGLGETEPDRPQLALGATLAGWASGSAGYAFIHVLCQTTVRVAGTPHAQTYAVMLPHGLRLLEPRLPDLLTRVAAALGADDPAPEMAAARAAHLGAQARVAGLSSLGVTEEHVPEIVDQASARAELRNTPDPPEAAELDALLRAAL
ncbi:MAG TPA: iron-containing alcohol dehydrogenase [Thermoleophilaceae bacterium]|nr:iron-containing alcohol dehydrogenase [Thermoleophilaceae bacterium]